MKYLKTDDKTILITLERLTHYDILTKSDRLFIFDNKSELTIAEFQQRMTEHFGTNNLADTVISFIISNIYS